MLHPLDWVLIGGYAAVLIVLSYKRGWEEQDEQSFLLSGRTMTLPAIVATLVSTWYGGILGVGEYTYQYGISQWLLFGFPYYLFALLFAYLLAGKIRENSALTIPEAVRNVYGKRAGRWSAGLIFLLVNPAPYILMLGLLLRFVLGGSEGTLLYAALIALFSVVYISFSGFSAVVRTDFFQAIFMFLGFGLLLFFSWEEAGALSEVWQGLPEVMRDPTGGHSWQYVMVWFFIALWTFVDPGFHQRCAASRDPQTAQRAIVWSVGFWALFDFLTLSCGLYTFAILGPDLHEPILAYPKLAAQLLPPGLLGLFMLTLVATIMSTMDSYLFLSGQTLGRDLLYDIFRNVRSNTLSRIGILASALLGLVLIVAIPSVVELWYVVGSLVIPGLLIPVLGIYLPLFRMKSRFVPILIAGSFLISTAWFLTGRMVEAVPLLGIEPFYPGLLLSVVIWLWGRGKEVVAR